MNKKKIFLIASSIFLAMIITVYVSPEVFMANTPRIRDDVGSRVLALLPSSIRGTTIEERLKDKPLVQFGEATYARTAPGESITYLDFDNMILDVFWVTTNKGNRMPILVPKGERPSEDLIEDLKNNY